MPKVFWEEVPLPLEFPFPAHNPDFPDVDPVSGDERETTDVDG